LTMTVNTKRTREVAQVFAFKDITEAAAQMDIIMVSVPTPPALSEANIETELPFDALRGGVYSVTTKY